MIQEKINVLLEQKGRIESEIENDSQKVKKSKNKLMLVENTKEYHAMMREMDWTVPAADLSFASQRQVRESSRYNAVGAPVSVKVTRT